MGGEALLGLFSGQGAGQDVVMEPATPADMRGQVPAPKPSLEVIYDES